MGAVMSSDIDTRPIAIEDNNNISEDGGIDSIVLDCGGGVKPWPKWKRFPPEVSDEMPPRLMGAIERVLRNSATRTTKYIFEPKNGMTFDCINEAREFYNMYGTATDGEARGNSYGAAGAREGLSDSELLSLRALDVKVVCGRPTINRYRPRAEIIKEKMQKKGSHLKKKNKKKRKKCTSCDLDNHKTSEM
ncbi:unnamed protein product [Urochloa humidicola]